jgi:hypothetical protein
VHLVPEDPRDRRRETDPLHDTVDESSGVVASAVDPDNTPIDKLIAAIRTEVGGYLTARDELMLREYEKHRERVQERSEKRYPHSQGPEVDRAKLASLLEHDMTGWPPFKDQAARLASLEAAEAGRAKVLTGVKRWVWASGLTALIALGGVLVDYGRRQAAGDSARDQAAADRQALIEQTARNHAQDIEIGVLRALVRTLERNNRRINGDD